jgi:hypothetical protein
MNNSDRRHLIKAQMLETKARITNDDATRQAYLRIAANLRKAAARAEVPASGKVSPTKRPSRADQRL